LTPAAAAVVVMPAGEFVSQRLLSGGRVRVGDASATTAQ